MTKRVSYNGIEISSEAYEASTADIFDYLEKLTGSIEKRLHKNDANCNLSINLEFSPGKLTRSSIYSHSSAGKGTVTHVTQALKSVRRKSGNNHFSGKAKINLQVHDH